MPEILQPQPVPFPPGDALSQLLNLEREFQVEEELHRKTLAALDETRVRLEREHRQRIGRLKLTRGLLWAMAGQRPERQ